jgi:hypothetical protein
MSEPYPKVASLGRSLRSLESGEGRSLRSLESGEGSAERPDSCAPLSPLRAQASAASDLQEASDLPRVSEDEAVQARYEAMRRKGESHRLAEMLAFGQGPALLTDAVFLENHCNGSQWAGPAQEWIGDLYKQEAAKAGVDVKGKIYLGGLARFPGDPEAWVSGRGDVKRVCESRGWGCTGAVEVKRQEPLTPAPVKAVADDIVKDLVEAKLDLLPEEERRRAEGPGGQAILEGLREEVVSTHAPHWQKGGA